MRYSGREAFQFDEVNTKLYGLSSRIAGIDSKDLEFFRSQSSGRARSSQLPAESAAERQRRRGPGYKDRRPLEMVSACEARQLALSVARWRPLSSPMTPAGWLRGRLIRAGPKSALPSPVASILARPFC